LSPANKAAARNKVEHATAIASLLMISSTLFLPESESWANAEQDTRRLSQEGHEPKRKNSAASDKGR
jgi:hypothetical protein